MSASEHQPNRFPNAKIDQFAELQSNLRNDLFNNSVYNVVSSNNTVSEILDLIRKNKKNIKIKLVKSRIMNQLSYEVSSNKIKKIGLRFQDDIKRGINDTLKLLEGINNE